MAKNKKVETIEEATDIFLTGSICLSDIPKNLIYVSEKNGKKYIRITISKKSQLFYGNTHQVQYSPTREEREGGINPIDIGNLVEWKKMDEQPPEVKKTAKASPAPQTKSEDTNDLPF